MKEKQLHRDLLPVTPVCLGTAQFGTSLSEKQAGDILDAYTGSGGNFLDTANCYGRWLPQKRQRANPGAMAAPSRRKAQSCDLHQGRSPAV